jgi:hypothetical protein
MSNYPSAKDTDLELPRVDNNITAIGGSAINSIRDAIFAIEDTLGVSPQGSLDSVAARLDVSLNSDGTIKSSALSSAGLVTLPITNSHIASGAAIEETKLDLDYTTTYLNTRISSSVADINALVTSINTLSSDVAQHFSGTASRHDGYAIDLSVSVLTGTTVEQGLHNVERTLAAHTDDKVDAHDASAISVADANFNRITSSTVQGALEDLDVADTAELVTHQDRSHENAIAICERGHQGSQGNLYNTVLAPTIFRTDTSATTEILKVLPPNVARVTGYGANLSALTISSSDVLRIQAGGVDRTYLDVNLSSVVGTDDMDVIVERINTVAHAVATHYPICAYNTYGELTIAHNIPGAQFTISILDTVTNSAATALGFENVAGTTFIWPEDDHFAYVGGQGVKWIKMVDQVITLSSDSATVDTGVDLTTYSIDTTEYGPGRITCNITEHSASDTENGTYYIVKFNSNSEIVLNGTITAGTFRLQIPLDAINFTSAGLAELHDIFLEYDDDGYGYISASKRIGYSTISGLQIKDISDGLLESSISNIYWNIQHGTFVRLVVDGENGPQTSFISGFEGDVVVYAADGINSAIVSVVDPPTVSATRQIYTETYGGGQDKLLLCTIHYTDYGAASPTNVQKVIKFIQDKRKFGTAYEPDYRDELSRSKLADALNELRNNGVIRGFEYISNTTNTVKVRGGRALVNGRIIDVDTINYKVDTSTDQTHLLVLNEHGKFKTFDDNDVGCDFANIINGDGYGDGYGVATIMEFEVTGSALGSSFYDRRLLVSNIDKQLDDLRRRIDELEAAVF